jgi:hypothetical protein
MTTKEALTHSELFEDPDPDRAEAIIAAGRDFNVLASNTLNEEVLASPAISGGRLFIRGTDYLVCIARRHSLPQGAANSELPR